ncbi:MAG: hypothetical protein V2J02_22440, partial [Pseudomonadales bacterium]|nr:hypothetical protein [Pseudomonadales bacterium]
ERTAAASTSVGPQHAHSSAAARIASFTLISLTLSPQTEGFAARPDHARRCVQTKPPREA